MREQYFARRFKVIAISPNLNLALWCTMAAFFIFGKSLPAQAQEDASPNTFEPLNAFQSIVNELSMASAEKTTRTFWGFTWSSQSLECKKSEDMCFVFERAKLLIYTDDVSVRAFCSSIEDYQKASRDANFNTSRNYQFNFDNLHQRALSDHEWLKKIYAYYDQNEIYLKTEKHPPFALISQSFYDCLTMHNQVVSEFQLLKSEFLNLKVLAATIPTDGHEEEVKNTGEDGNFLSVLKLVGGIIAFLTTVIALFSQMRNRTANQK